MGYTSRHKTISLRRLASRKLGLPIKYVLLQCISEHVLKHAQLCKTRVPVVLASHVSSVRHCVRTPAVRPSCKSCISMSRSGYSTTSPNCGSLRGTNTVFIGHHGACKDSTERRGGHRNRTDYNICLSLLLFCHCSHVEVKAPVVPGSTRHRPSGSLHHPWRQRLEWHRAPWSACSPSCRA